MSLYESVDEHHERLYSACCIPARLYLPRALPFVRSMLQACTTFQPLGGAPRLAMSARRRALSRARAARARTAARTLYAWVRLRAPPAPSAAAGRSRLRALPPPILLRRRRELTCRARPFRVRRCGRVVGRSPTVFLVYHLRRRHEEEAAGAAPPPALSWTC